MQTTMEACYELCTIKLHNIGVKLHVETYTAFYCPFVIGTALKSSGGKSENKGFQVQLSYIAEVVRAASELLTQLKEAKQTLVVAQKRAMKIVYCLLVRSIKQDVVCVELHVLVWQHNDRPIVFSWDPLNSCVPMFLAQVCDGSNKEV
ncbi:hypothetical protein V6N13_005632 [Hibiscus sabdariffa]|uniref:Uncharacterized protein n=1 Tax=Hibiscus sabdariffa TaxID=183260 RepID=A0ABR2EQ77_9ROSI